MPNCPGAKLSGAKLSWCQIVRVPNCPLLLSWCQILRFYHLGAKLSAFIFLVLNCPLYYLGAKLSSAKLSGAKLSGAKFSYNPSSSSLPAPKAQERWRNNKELHQVPLANCRSAILTLMKAMMIMPSLYPSS